MSEKTELFCRLPSKSLSLEQWWAHAIWRPFMFFPLLIAATCFVPYVGVVFAIVAFTAASFGLFIYLIPALLLTHLAKARQWSFRTRKRILFYTALIAPFIACTLFVTAFGYGKNFALSDWLDAIWRYYLIGLAMSLSYYGYVSYFTHKLIKNGRLVIQDGVSLPVPTDVPAA